MRSNSSIVSSKFSAVIPYYYISSADNSRTSYILYSSAIAAYSYAILCSSASILAYSSAFFSSRCLLTAFIISCVATTVPKITRVGTTNSPYKVPASANNASSNPFSIPTSVATSTIFNLLLQKIISILIHLRTSNSTLYEDVFWLFCI